MSHQDPQQFIPSPIPSNPTKSKGTKSQIIPNKLTKIVYRQGIGQFPKPGASIFALFSCYKIDGKCLIKCNEGQRFTVGIGRLIQGLEIVLMGVRKQQKFTVLIAPQYGYKDINICTQINLDKSIKNSKLIFQFQIISIDYFQLQYKSQCDALATIKTQYQKITPYILQNNPQKSIKMLTNLIQKLDNLKYQKTDILINLYLKQMKILYNQKKYKQALKICQPIFKLQQNNENLLILLSRIYIQLNEIGKAKILMTRCYNYSNKQNKYIGILYKQFMNKLEHMEYSKQIQGQFVYNDKDNDNNNNNNDIQMQMQMQIKANININNNYKAMKIMKIMQFQNININNKIVEQYQMQKYKYKQQYYQQSQQQSSNQQQQDYKWL